MGRGQKPGKSKAKPAVVRKSPKDEGARVRDLEKRLAEALKGKAEAQEQQAAMAEILQVIRRSSADTQPVFDLIVNAAARLLRTEGGILTRVTGERIELAAFTSSGAAGDEALRAGFPVSVHIAGSMQGITIRDRAPFVSADFATDHRLNEGTRNRLGARGFRSGVSVPLLDHGAAIGAISVTRRDPGMFTPEDIALLQTFADQAVIAIENVRLFNETKEALERQTATSEILRVIAGSPTDVQPVFATIMRNALRLCSAQTAAVLTFDGHLIHAGAFLNIPADAEEQMRRLFPRVPDRSSAAGRAILTGDVAEIPDVEADPDYVFASAVRAGGLRSNTAVPMLRDGRAIGTINLGRTVAGRFAESEIAILKTFADQAVIAIENVRLFNETTEALDRQTATSEILRVISSSPTDVQPVFDAIAENALRLCEATFSAVFRYDGELIHLAALRNVTPAGAAAIRDMYPMPPGRGGTAARSILSRSIAHVADVLHDPEYAYRGVAEAAEFRSILSVPMLRDGQPIGAITVAGPIERPFPAKQVELLRLFADQAVIAIENVRLFKELEASNREIAEKSRQIEVASQHKSEFLANMSHELRTPLNAIIGFSEVLAERMFGELNEKQEEYSKDIHASGQHLLSLINDILDLSKIEAGRMELELTDFHLLQAIENALTLVRERAGRRGIALAHTIDERLGEIRGDERKIKQVLLNLLSNALKFTPEGGRVEVRAGMVDGTAEISVTDTGVGIAPEDQGAIFEEFRQVGTAEKKAEGTGLGLTLCRRFIELHGGRIWVKSQVGMGSTFTFTIPVRSG